MAMLYFNALAYYRFSSYTAIVTPDAVLFLNDRVVAPLVLNEQMLAEGFFDEHMVGQES